MAEAYICEMGGDYNGQWHSTVFIEYAKALESAGPRLKEFIMHRLEQEGNLDLDEAIELYRIAYPKE